MDQVKNQQANITAALSRVDVPAIERHVENWLAGLLNDRELSDAYQIEALSYETGTGRLDD